MLRIACVMVLDKTTKGALRYRECDADGSPLENMRDGSVGQLYIRKDALNGAAPDKIAVLVREEPIEE